MHPQHPMPGFQHPHTQHPQHPQHPQQPQQPPQQGPGGGSLLHNLLGSGGGGGGGGGGPSPVAAADNIFDQGSSSDEDGSDDSGFDPTPQPYTPQPPSPDVQATGAEAEPAAATDDVGNGQASVAAAASSAASSDIGAVTGIAGVSGVALAAPESVPITRFTGGAYSIYLGERIAVNAQFICYALKEGKARVIGRREGSRLVLKGHTQDIVDMAFYSATDSLLATCGADGQVRGRGRGCGCGHGRGVKRGAVGGDMDMGAGVKACVKRRK